MIGAFHWAYAAAACSVPDTILHMVTNTETSAICGFIFTFQDLLIKYSQVSYYHLKLLLLINAKEFYHFP